MGGVDVWHEQSRFLGHTRANVLHISETEDVLNFRDLTDLVGETFDLLEHGWRVDVIGDYADYSDLIAAKYSADLIVVRLFWITFREQAIDRAVQMDMPRVVGKKAGEQKYKEQNTLRSINDQV